MSLTRDHNDIVFQCDGCAETLETGTSNFEAARNLIKRAHWRPSRKFAGRLTADSEWEHFCPDCDGAAPAARFPRQRHVGE